MRRFAFAILLLALIGATLAAVAIGPSAHEPVHSTERLQTATMQTATLQVAAPQLSGWDYRLSSLASCEVGDGIAVLKNGAQAPMRITDVRMITSGGGPVLDAAHWTYALMRFRRGSTTGELAGSFALTALGNARASGAAIGGVLDPVVQGGSWYDVVARLRLPTGRTPAWDIRGIEVSYKLGTQVHTSTFGQSIELPGTSHCS